MKQMPFQEDDRFPSFYGTGRFTAMSPTSYHRALSLAQLIQHMPTHPTSLGYILILSSHLCLGLASGPFPSGFPTKTLHAFLFPHTNHMTCPSHPIDLIT